MYLPRNNARRTFKCTVNVIPTDHTTGVAKPDTLFNVGSVNIQLCVNNQSAVLFCVLIGCYIISEDITDLSPEVVNCGIIVHVSKASCITECILNKILNVCLQLLDRTVKLTAVKIKVSRNNRKKEKILSKSSFIQISVFAIYWSTTNAKYVRT